MKKAYFALLFLVAAFARAEAQDVKVCVTDHWNRPLSEVAITIADDRTVAARTDDRGEAVIQAPEGSRITLTLFNRKSKTVRVEGSRLNVQLSENDRLLDLGYDERISKSESTAALAAAASEEIEASGHPSLMNNLYGLIPGLGVYQGNNLLQEDRRYGADQSVDQDTYQCDRQQHRIELKQGFQQSAKHTLGGTTAAAGIAAGRSRGGITLFYRIFTLHHDHLPSSGKCTLHDKSRCSSKALHGCR